VDAKRGMRKISRHMKNGIFVKNAQMDRQERFGLSRTLNRGSEHSPHLILLRFAWNARMCMEAAENIRLRHRTLYPMVSLRRFREADQVSDCSLSEQECWLASKCLNDEQPDFYTVLLVD